MILQLGIVRKDTIPSYANKEDVKKFIMKGRTLQGKHIALFIIHYLHKTRCSNRRVDETGGSQQVACEGISGSFGKMRNFMCLPGVCEPNVLRLQKHPPG